MMTKPAASAKAALEGEWYAVFDELTLPDDRVQLAAYRDNFRTLPATKAYKTWLKSRKRFHSSPSQNLKTVLLHVQVIKELP